MSHKAYALQHLRRMKTRITIMVRRKIAAALPMSPTPREALNFSCDENKPYREGLGQI